MAWRARAGGRRGLALVAVVVVASAAAAVTIERGHRGVPEERLVAADVAHPAEPEWPGLDLPAEVDVETPVPTTADLPSTPPPTEAVPAPLPRPPLTVPSAPAPPPRVAVEEARSGDLLSVAPDGSPGNDDSGNPSASADGRRVAFVSRATNLVADDANGVADIFLRDTVARTTTRILGVDDRELDGPASWPAISGDGTKVAFVSSATNVVADDGNGLPDLFLHDVVTRRSMRLAEGRDESLAMVALSADGSTYAFTARDGAYAGSVRQHPAFIAPGGQWPALSADGRLVAFTTAMRGLAPGDEVSNQDVFVHDRSSGRVSLVSGGADGSQPNAGSLSGPRSMSADGRLVSFISVARLTADDRNDTADVYVHDLSIGSTRLVPEPGRGAGGNATYHPAISPDGEVVAFTRPGRDPTAIAWNLSTDRVTSIAGGAPKGPLNGLTIAAGAYWTSTPEGEVLGGSRWDRYQVIRIDG